ncbi:hypothetical protein AB0N05_11595 [Nocardia sp. NPDC051030]|uniref:hypothetical protein n=1 Tax=Nocardia sp. NPDC051030 TaxID=3155162 RepID=UPI003426EB70
MRLGGIVIGAVAAVSLVAGCGGSGGNQSVPQPKPSTPRAELLLTASDFPAGTKTEVIPPDKTDKTAETAEPSNSGQIPVTSIGCSTGTGSESDKDSSAILASNDDHDLVYMERVADAAMNIGKIKDAILRECADKTFHTSAGDVHRKTAVISLPDGLHADEAIEYRSDITAPRDEMNMETIAAFAIVRGMTVTLDATLLGSAVLDKAVFDRLFVAAVEKVVSAK